MDIIVPKSSYPVLLVLFSFFLAAQVACITFSLKSTITEGSYSFFNDSIWDGPAPTTSLAAGDTYNFSASCVRQVAGVSRCLINVTNVPAMSFSDSIILNGDVLLDVSATGSLQRLQWNKGGLSMPSTTGRTTFTIANLVFTTATQAYFDDSSLYWLLDRVDLAATDVSFFGRVLITTAGTVSFTMTNIAIGNNGPSNNPYIRIVPRSGFGSGDATITIAGPLTVPGRTGLQYEPDLNIEAKSIVFPTPFVADVGARAYLRMISQSSIIWGVNSQITLHRDYARFQLATPSQSWSTLPKVVIDGSSSDPNAAPAFIWGAPERLPAATRLNIDSATPSGSEIVETWFFIHNGQLRFSNTSPNQIGPFNRLFMYPNTEFVQEGTPTSAKTVQTRQAFLGTNLNTPLVLRWVNLNITTAIVDTLPTTFQFQDLPVPGENSKIEFTSSRFIIAAGATAEFSRISNLVPATAASSCSATTSLCGFENQGATTFRQALANHNIGVPFDNRGSFTFTGTNVNGNATIAVFLSRNIFNGEPTGGDWIFQVPATKPQTPAVAFSAGTTPNGASPGYNFGASWRFIYSANYITTVAFLDGDYYFPASTASLIRNSAWRHATLEIDPGTTTQLVGVVGVNFGARQRGGVQAGSMPTATLDFSNYVTLTSDAAFSQPATYLLNTIKFEGSGFLSNWRMLPDENHPLNVAFYEGNFQIDGVFYSELAPSDLNVKFLAEPGAKVNVTGVPTTIDVVNRGLIRILPASQSAIDTNAVARIDHTGVFVQESVGTLLLSYASPVASGTQPNAGQFIRFTNSASVMNGTVGIQDPRRTATLSRGSYYVAALPRGNAAASVALEYLLLNPGDAATARIVNDGSSDWVVVDVAQAPPPALAPDAGSNVSGGSSVVGAAVGGSIGALVFIIALVALLLFLIRRKKKNEKKKGDSETVLAPANGQYGAIGTPMESKPKKRKDNGESETSEDAPPQYGSIGGASASSQLERSVSGIDQSKKLLKQKKADDWQIPFEDLSFDRELGSGAFGSVWKGQWNASAVAIKQSLLVSATASQQADFEHEAKLMTKLRPHPNVVHTWGLSVAKDRILLVMEYCARGSLTKYFGSKKNALTVEKKLRIIADLAKGISHLHKNKIVHRDIAARNVLLTKDWTAKISDFGMSRLIGNSETKGTTASNIGPVRWMAPESIKTKEYSPQTDVWSFGITVWEIFSETEPHAQLDMLDAAIKIRDEKITPPMLDTIPEPVQALLQKCWAPNPDDRPTFDDIIKDCTAMAGAEESEESSSSE